ncbi:MAG TPA: tetratricopeptide repeat protein [Thermoanaerobaculia bacterium]|nr:tetratricopeptide repeat protein [Thermoanaerobaculia bacterium]
MIWLLVLALVVPIRESNSRASTVRGVKEFEKKEYAQAIASFADARKASPTSQSAFNLGTAQIAEGQHAEGSATLAEAMKDPKLRADALYNRGNSALDAKAFDHAVRDFAEVLRLRPNDARAKRNLEIALTRRAQQQQQGSGQDKSSTQQGPGGQKPQPAPANQQQKQAKKGEADQEALLRAIEQQEREELSRMNRAGRSSAKVGW